jgi:anti-sigma B factor antagonist
VTVRGEIGLVEAPGLTALLEQALAADALDVVVDLSGTDALDSAALGSIVLALKHVRRRGGSLAVMGAAGDVRRLFEVTGLARTCGLPADGEASAAGVW